MAGLRIFSYLPNPRVWKATIAARFCRVDVEIRGASGKELRDWLWDYDARPLAEQERESLLSLARTGRVGLTGAKLFKTDAFLIAQPFGNVPAAFGPDGKIGIFESNSIMRAVARLFTREPRRHLRSMPRDLNRRCLRGGTPWWETLSRSQTSALLPNWRCS